MFINDWFKKLITPKTAPRQLQTDSPTSVMLNRELAIHPTTRLSPARMATMFMRAEQGWLVDQAYFFMDMEERDIHISAELHKRKMSVKKLDWALVEPHNASAKERKNTKALEELLRDEIDIGTLRFNLLDAIGHGYSCTEIAWGRTINQLWIPKMLDHRPASWFITPNFDRNTLHLRDYSQPYGAPLTPFGWIVHLHKSRSGYIARTGLHRALAWPYLYKHYSLRDLAEFLEIYGLPIRIGKYNTNSTPQEKTDLLNSVLSIGHNAAGIIPDTMQMELHQVSSTGNADSFKVMIDWAESAMSKAILGGTLTSTIGAHGNRSLGDVHNEVRIEFRDDDAQQLDRTLTDQLVYPLAILNGYFDPGRTPTFTSDIQEPDDLAVFGNAIPKLVQAGAKIPVNYINDKLKIPVPEEGEEILTYINRTETITTDNEDIPNQAADNTSATSAIVKLIRLIKGQADACQSKDGLESGTVAEFRMEDQAAMEGSTKSPGTAQSQGQPDIDPTPVSAEIDLLALAASPSIKTMIDQIRGIVDQADSLEALRDNLIHGYGHLNTDELVKIMALAFATADLAGRFDVHEGD